MSCALILGFHPSTVGRELKRGAAVTTTGYDIRVAKRRAQQLRTAANQQHRRLHEAQAAEITGLIRRYYSPDQAGQAVLKAHAAWGYTIAMVQADNGPEYGHYFAQVMRTHGITTRHTRLHRPNDNAHIERFNRTIQTECIGYFWHRNVPLQRQRDTLTAYLDFYNHEREHLGIQLRVPAAMLQRS